MWLMAFVVFDRAGFLKSMHQPLWAKSASKDARVFFVWHLGLHSVLSGSFLACFYRHSLSVAVWSWGNRSVFARNDKVHGQHQYSVSPGYLVYAHKAGSLFHSQLRRATMVPGSTITHASCARCSSLSCDIQSLLSGFVFHVVHGLESKEVSIPDAVCELCG